MLKESPKDKPNNKLEQNKITKFSKEQDVKYQEQESSGLKKSACELTSDREPADAELSAVVQYTKLNDSDVDKTTMYRDESEHRRNSNSIGAIIQEQIVETSKVVCSTGASAAAHRRTNCGWPMPQVHEQIVEVVRISDRNVEQIVEDVHNIPMEAESAQMERIRGTSR